MEIKVTNCQECPFVKEDACEDYKYCSISEEVSKALSYSDFEELPSESVHELCPLKKDNITVTL